MNEQTNQITLSDESLGEFKKSMKIGFYRSFYNKGIITAAQFERLIHISENSSVLRTAHAK